MKVKAGGLYLRADLEVVRVRGDVCLYSEAPNGFRTWYYDDGDYVISRERRLVAKIPEDFDDAGGILTPLSWALLNVPISVLMRTYLYTIKAPI